MQQPGQKMKTIPVRHINADQHEQKFLGNFRIRKVQKILAGKNMTQDLHRHDFFFILVLEKGIGSHAIDFVSYDVGDRAVFFLRPGQVHQLSLKVGSKGFLIEFRPDFYYHDKESNQLLRRASSKNYYKVAASTMSRLLGILSSVDQEYSNKKQGYQEVIKASLGIFFIELGRQRERDSQPVNKARAYAQEQLEKLLELLELHISTHKQVSHYADMMNLSPFQVNSITKDTLGKTCSELIDEAIVLESKRYLLATTNQVNQIAHHLGYEDVSYFIRFFRKQTGLTPDVFRQNFM